MQTRSKILDSFCVLFVDSTFSPWFACNPWWSPWGLICTHRLLLPQKVIALLTLPLSWIRPSKERAICAKSCKDQETVTKQKCSLLFLPAIAYAVAQSCEKFFAHIAMDVLPRNCFILEAHCDSFLFLSLTEATHPMNSTYAYLPENAFQFQHLQCFMKLFITFLSLFIHVWLPCSSLPKPQKELQQVTTTCVCVCWWLSWPKSLLMNLRPSLLF